MPNIQLKAKLQAYSRAPYYLDYVREAPKDDASYIRKNGEWINLDTTLLGDTLDSFQSQVKDLEAQLGKVDIYLDDLKENLIFIFPDGNAKSIKLPTSRVDNITIGINSDKKLYQIDSPDGKTIRIVNEVWEALPRDTDVYKKVSGELRAESLYATQSEQYITGNDLIILKKNVSDLENAIQGTSGYLDPHNFYNDIKAPLISLSDKERNRILTDYAISQLGEAPKNQTKIRDLYDSRVWVYSNGVWVDEGQDIVFTANNNGILGTVTGVKYDGTSRTKYKVSIDTDVNGKTLGTMSVNGIAEEFQKVLYKEDIGNPEVGSIVQRTDSGTIKAADPKEDDDVITQGAFNTWVDESTMNEDDLNSLLEVFK